MESENTACCIITTPDFTYEFDMDCKRKPRVYYHHSFTVVLLKHFLIYYYVVRTSMFVYKTRVKLANRDARKGGLALKTLVRGFRPVRFSLFFSFCPTGPR